jgi:methionyl aminopeptidase
MRSRVPSHSPADISRAREAAQLAAEVLRMITPHVQPGVTTEALDQRCHDFIVNELKVIPANLGYMEFPKTVLTSVNQVVCHGIPSASTVLKAGDIVNIDVAVNKNGWFGDTSRMYFVGEPSALARRLVETTYEALCAGIRQVRPGGTLGDVGHAIQTVAQRERFSVVREYGGHGIGQVYHDEPQVLHYGQRGQGLRLEEGMVFTIEPMINAGTTGPCRRNGSTWWQSPPTVSRCSPHGPKAQEPTRPSAERSPAAQLPGLANSNPSVTGGHAGKSGPATGEHGGHAKSSQHRTEAGRCGPGG